MIFRKFGKALNEVLGNNLEPLKTLARDLGSFTENYTRVVNPTETHAITAQEYAEIIVRDLINIVRLNTDRHIFAYALTELFFAIRIIIRHDNHGLSDAAAIIRPFESELTQHRLWKKANPDSASPATIQEEDEPSRTESEDDPPLPLSGLTREINQTLPA